MINNGVGIDTDSSCSAGLDHIAELLSRTVATIKSVAHWLIVEPPGVKLSVLGPFHREDTLLRREYLNSHPAHLAERRAFSLDVSIGPSEHLNDGTLLPLVVLRTLRDVGTLPHKVKRLESNVPILSGIVRASHLDGKI